MSNPSPQAPEEIEPRPQAFAILPQYNEAGILIAFTVQDPEGDVIRSRAKVVAAIHEEYPGVSLSELDGAKIAYYDYHAAVVLPQRTANFTKM